MVIDFENLSALHSKIFKQIFINAQDEFNTAIGSYINSTDRSTFNLTNNISSRSTLQSELFYNIVVVLVAKYCLEVDKSLETIIFPNYRTYKFFSSEFKSKYDNVKLAYNSHPLKHLRLRGLRSILKSGYQFIISKRKKRIKQIVLDQPLILLETFILQNSIDSGTYHDRYYPGLLNSLELSKRSNVYLLPTILGSFSGRQIDRIYESCDERFLFMQDFLSIKDHFNAIWQIFKAQIPNNGFIINGIDFGRLLRAEASKTKYSRSNYCALINYSFVKNMKRFNIPVNLFIDWNENQPIDRGMILGFREYYPDTVIKGYRGYVVSEDFNFNLIPSPVDIDYQLFPDLVCVMGKSFINEDIINQGVAMETSPAFRFSHLRASDYNSKKPHILVVLSISYDESNYVLNKIAYAIENLEDSVTVFVKKHPSYQKHKGLDMISRRFQFIGQDEFLGVFKSAKIVLGSSSSSMMEAVANGTPTIIIGSNNGLPINPIPKTVDPFIWKLCYESDEIKKAINRYLGLKDEEMERCFSIGKQITIDYFEPVNELNIRKFLQV